MKIEIFQIQLLSGLKDLQVLQQEKHKKLLLLNQKHLDQHHHHNESDDHEYEMKVVYLGVNRRKIDREYMKNLTKGREQP